MLARARTRAFERLLMCARFMNNRGTPIRNICLGQAAQLRNHLLGTGLNLQDPEAGWLRQFGLSGRKYSTSFVYMRNISGSRQRHLKKTTCSRIQTIWILNVGIQGHGVSYGSVSKQSERKLQSADLAPSENGEPLHLLAPTRFLTFV